MSRGKVLVLEDDADILFALEDLLTDSGFTVTPVRTSTAAGSALLAYDFDLFLSDMLLSEPDTGLDLVRKLLGTGRVPPVLFLTGLPPERVRELFDFGPPIAEALFPRGYGLLYKPFDETRLLTAMNVLLKR